MYVYIQLVFVQLINHLSLESKVFDKIVRVHDSSRSTTFGI